jgi:hypothetical protein
MADRPVAARIDEIDARDLAGLEQLSRELAEDGRRAAREVVAALHAGPAQGFSKPAWVLVNLGDLALTPLLDGLDAARPEQCVWDLGQALEIEIATRRRLAAALRGRLDDRRALALPEPRPPVEERPIPRRVCDEAYMQLRRLVSFEEDEDALLLNNGAFLRLGEAERDAEIARARTSRRWVALAAGL